MAASAQPKKDLVAVKRQLLNRVMFGSSTTMAKNHRQILMDYWDHDLNYPPKETVWFKRCQEVMEVLREYELLPGEQT